MRLRKRLLSLLLVLVLTFTLLPAAEAKTGTLVSNTGTRHTVCTSLSSQALAYYTGNHTYDVVSGLAASSTDPMSSAMFSRLSTLMSSTMTNSVSYNSLTNYWPKTDANNGSSNPILFYSDAISGSFNREHVWPKSRGSFYQSGAGSDLHHLRPTNDTINSTRGNMTMGNVKGVYDTYSTKAYDGRTVLWYNTSADIVEVNDNIKGDVARVLLYVWCRWQEPNLYENDPDPYSPSGDTGGNNGLKVIESLSTLLQWMETDPVDTWEMSRNDQCENVQGNRNVFIDYPEYAWLLFGLTPPSDYATPSGEAMNATSYTITAAANNSAWGSVSVSGRTVTATPNTGYYVADATVSPAGAATLTRDGNSFTVSNMTADCTVTVNFAAKTVLTVSFAANGGTGTMAAQQVYAGEAFTLPACGFTAPGGKVFAGWKWSQDNAIYQPNATVTVSANSTFTAQWATPSDDATYVLVETAPSDWSGDYLIVYNDGPYAMDGSLSSLDVSSNYKTVSIDSKTITVDGDENDFYFTIAQSDSSYTVKSASGYYIGWASNSANGLSCSADTAYPVTLSLTGTDANIVGSAGAYLRFNTQSGQTRFRFFKSSSYTNQKAISLYKRQAVTPPEPQAEPAFKTQALTLEGKIGVDFFVDLPQIDGVVYEGVDFTIDSVDGADAFVPFSGEGHPTNNSGYYQFTYYVRTIEMANTVTATLRYTLNGEDQTLEKTYSVRQYFEAIEQSISSYPEKVRNMIKATADYGHYVQAFLDTQRPWTLGTDYAEMDKHYTDYTSDDISAAQTGLAEYATAKTVGANMQKITYTLVWDSDTELRVYFKPAATYTGTFTFTANGDPITENGEKISAALQPDGRYLVSIKNIAAHELTAFYTIKAIGDGVESVMTVSPLSYVRSIMTNYADNTAAVNAAVAVYRYAMAAKALKP